MSTKYPEFHLIREQRGGGGCQFSYICDGHADTMRDDGAMWRASRIARVMMDGAPRALTQGATHFHTVGVRPSSWLNSR